MRRYLALKRRISAIETRRLKRVAAINEQASKQAEPAWDELNAIGARLWHIAGPVIEHLGAGKRTAVLTSGTIKLQRSPDSLKITDEKKALKRISDLGWSSKAVQVKRTIKKDALKRLLTSGGSRRNMAGTLWVDGSDLLYIDGNVKVDQEIIATHDDSEDS